MVAWSPPVLMSALQTKPYRGIHVGNVSFVVPGLDGTDEMEVGGNWITTSLSKEGYKDAEVAQRFDGFHHLLQENMQRSAEKAKAIMLAS